MPCNCDHLEPTFHERESQRVAQFIVHLTAYMDMDCPKWVAEAALNIYGAPERVHTLTRALCALCEQVDENIIYNAHDRTARDLADWWEDHQEADARKAKQAKEQTQKAQLKKSAKAKLTNAELEALELS